MGRRRIRWTRVAVAAAFVVAAGLASSCGGGGGDEQTTVDVTLQEFSVITSQASAPAGSVTFQVTNTGPQDVHEFVVLKTDLAPDALPTDDHGTAREEADGIEPVDEIEDVAVGGSGTLTVDLEAGSYVLVCNIYDEQKQEAHYRLGMRAPFTVE